MCRALKNLQMILVGEKAAIICREKDLLSLSRRKIGQLIMRAFRTEICTEMGRLCFWSKRFLVWLGIFQVTYKTTSCWKYYHSGFDVQVTNLIKKWPSGGIKFVALRIFYKDGKNFCNARVVV